MSARVVLNRGLARIAGDDILWRVLGGNRLAPLCIGQRIQERASQILFGAERAGPLGRCTRYFFQDLGGIGAKKGGSSRQRLAVHNRPVLSDVVSLVAPAPRGRARLPEDGEEIQFRIAPRRFLDGAENDFQAADRFGLGESFGAEARTQQIERGLPLRLRHVFERQALPFSRHEVPVEPFLGVERPANLRRLLLIEGANQGLWQRWPWRRRAESGGPGRRCRRP